MADAKQSSDAPKRAPRWPWVLGGAVIVLFIAYVLYDVLAERRRQRTSDAYVTAHYATIAPRIVGQVSHVEVTDNQAVRAGQLLVALDDRDEQHSLAESEASLAADRARVEQASAQVERQPTMIRRAAAQISAETARVTLAQADLRRFTSLAGSGAGTVQQQQQATATLQEAESALAAARADYRAARIQGESLAADRSAATARVGADEAQTAQARLNLSYTRILAPIDGVVDQRAVQVGNYVSPGSPMLVIVPLAERFILANYREPALRRMRPGQRVQVHVDAYDIDLEGVVDSLAPSSGTAYSPIPPNNASGNFTKIVQRFPVKIVFVDGQPLTGLVKVGMSVETIVDTRP